MIRVYKRLSTKSVIVLNLFEFILKITRNSVYLITVIIHYFAYINILKDIMIRNMFVN